MQECPEWYCSNPLFQCWSYWRHCADMLATLYTRGSRGPHEFEAYGMRQVTAESGPLLRPIRIDVDTASTCCQADDVQLRQKDITTVPPTERRALPNWRTYCNVNVLISRGNFSHKHTCCNMMPLHVALCHTLCFMFAVNTNYFPQ